MQLCGECGAEIPNDAQFCGRCGSKMKIEDDITRSTDFVPVENEFLLPPEGSTALEDSQIVDPNIHEEEKFSTTTLPSEESGENEEHISHVVLEPEGEETTSDPVIETSRERQEQDPTLKNDLEEPGHNEPDELASSMPADTISATQIPTNQLSADQSSSTQSPNPLQETQISYAASSKLRSRPASKRLLFSLIGLIAIIGVIAALVGLFHQSLPVVGGSANVLSGSPNNEIIDPNGSSLTASICINASTPSSNETGQGSSFTLTSSSGCSNVVASKADSTCLIFPSDGANSHKFIVDVSNAVIVNSSYHLVLSIVNYTVPQLYADSKQISIGLSEGSSGRNFSWFYRSGSVTVNHDELSGSMDVILVPEKGVNTLHVVGVWACGHQIKSS